MSSTQRHQLVKLVSLYTQANSSDNDITVDDTDRVLEEVRGHGMYEQVISHNSVLRRPSVRTLAYGQRSFAYSAPSTWNSLPQQVRSSDSVSTFRSQTKTHLFRLAYYRREENIDFYIQLFYSNSSVSTTHEKQHSDQLFCGIFTIYFLNNL